MSVGAWDTNLVSRVLRGGSRHQEMLDRAVTDPVATTAVSVSEVVYGLQLVTAIGATAEFLGYIDDGLITVLAFDDAAAAIYGKLRAAAPERPAAARGDRRSRTELRVAWSLDLMIACTAYAHGYGVRTADVDHFRRIADALATDVIEAGDPPLDVDPA